MQHRSCPQRLVLQETKPVQCAWHKPHQMDAPDVAVDHVTAVSTGIRTAASLMQERDRLLVREHLQQQQ
jgi:hypothetical protein